MKEFPWKDKITEDLWYWYVKQTNFEEVLFRLGLLWIFALFTPMWLAIVLSAILYGLAHFILFKWQMVVASGILGIPLGIVFVEIVKCGLGKGLPMLMYFVFLAFVIVWVMHYIAGTFCAWIGWTKKWIK